MSFQYYHSKLFHDSMSRPVSSPVRLAQVSFSGWIVLSSATLHTPREESSSLSSLLPNPRIQTVSCAKKKKKNLINDFHSFRLGHLEVH